MESEESKIICKTILAKNVVRTIFDTERPEKNELFFPGRMAYIVELEEDINDVNVSDIPTTIIRSKADIQAGANQQQSLSNSTNDIVINKLTQILSYLRAGNRNKKKKKDKYSTALGLTDSLDAINAKNLQGKYKHTDSTKINRPYVCNERMFDSRLFM